MERLIFHVDVNSAFLSWEAVRRISDGNEDIRLIPSAISGDPANRTGVILAKSIPAKQYGIRTGEPVGMALKKCPDLFLARPDFKLYEKNSRAFMDICRRYAPVVEKFSIDECFLDMTGTDKLYPNPIEIAYRIKEEIKEKLGFTVNVGAGPNKLLAKMASDMEKPDKVHTLFISQIQEKLWPLPVRELYSVGRATAQKLEKAGIRTIGELANAFLPFLQSLLGKKAGKKLHEYAISYTEIYSRLMQQAETMGEAWQGADNLAYVEQINGFCDNLRGMSEKLQEAGDVLLQQKMNYVNRQEDNIAQVKKLTN